VTYLAAFGGGVVSFLSPCVLPLVPAYLSMITGLDITAVEERTARQLGRIARDTGLFVAGFGTVFIVLGLAATTMGQLLFRNQILLTRLSGVVLLAMALFLLGSLFLKAPWLYAERRFHPSPSRWGPLAAPITGVAFGFGWTPCIGPVLGSVLVVAGTQGRATSGAGLLAVYSLGLGLPFLATGLAFGRLTRTLGWVKRHFTGITIASSTIMAFFGLLLALNRLSWVTVQLQSFVKAIGLGRLVNLG
jgi:cytochrome c-type biogenesis protein